MSTRFETVFNSFLSKIQDMDLAILGDEDIENNCLRYLDEALMYINMNNLVMVHEWTIDPDMDEFVEDLDPAEIQVLTYYMVAAWYDARINSLENTRAIFGASSDRWTDQAKFQKQLIAARKQWLLEARDLFRNYNVLNNDYLGDNT